jgi:aerobic carbon-monoxide dehydrogenase medium subunit
MIPAPFEYEVAESVEHASELLGQNPDAKILAGGHSLLPAMRLRIARPALLVDIGRLGDLRYIREDGDRIAIGAMSRHSDVQFSDLLREQCGLLPFAAAFVGDPQVRHRGTIGGSVAHGDPASDMPSALLALDAEFVVRGPDGERTVASRDFFVSVFETALGPQDVLTELRVPKTGPSGFDYQKFYRRAQDWATVGVAAVRVDGGVNVALTSMGATPLRADAVEEALRGGADPAAAAEHAADGADPPSDVSASSEYRRELAKVLVRRAVEKALQ